MFPEYISTAAAVVCTCLLFFNYFQRYMGIHKKKWQIHPVTVGSWVIAHLLNAAYLFSVGNPTTATISAISLVLSAVLLVWGAVSLKNKKLRRGWKVTWADGVCLGLFLVSAVFYYGAGSPVLAALVLYLGSIVADIPMLYKAWVAPHTDAIRYYMPGCIRYFLLTFTLDKWEIIGWTSTWMWGIFILFEMVFVVIAKKRKHRRYRRR